MKSILTISELLKLAHTLLEEMQDTRDSLGRDREAFAAQVGHYIKTLDSSVPKEGE